VSNRVEYDMDMLSPICRVILWSTQGAAIAETLRQIGCEVEIAHDEDEAIELKATLRPEIIYLDDVPAGACGRLRRTPPSLDVLYCALLSPTALGPVDRPEFDDFVLLPLQSAEVAARIRLWRWRRQQISGTGLLRSGALVVELANLRVTWDGAPITLTFKEFELLCLLLRRRGQVLTREFILDSVWGPDYLGGDRTVDVHIRRLRMKLPEISDQIATVHGTGYRFER